MFSQFENELHYNAHTHYGGDLVSVLTQVLAHK